MPGSLHDALPISFTSVTRFQHFCFFRASNTYFYPLGRLSSSHGLTLSIVATGQLIRILTLSPSSFSLAFVTSRIRSSMLSLSPNTPVALRSRSSTAPCRLPGTVCFLSSHFHPSDWFFASYHSQHIPMYICDPAHEVIGLDAMKMFIRRLCLRPLF